MQKFAVAGLLLLGCLISSSVIAQTVSVGSDTIITGDQANVDVNFTNNGTVFTVFVEINYDTNAVSFVNCSNCTPLSPGSIEIDVSDPSIPIPDGVLASLQFQSQPGFTGPTNLTVGTISECLDVSGVPVACNFNGGNITINPLPAPIGSISPTDLTLTVDPGQTSPVQTITVSNGPAATAALNISNIAISIDSGNGIFSITGGDCGSGTALVPGDQCTIDVTFQGAPAAPDDTIGVLAVITNDLNLPSVNLNGLTRIVNVPSPTISPATLDFNTVQLGTARTLAATVNNPSSFSDLLIFGSASGNPPTISGAGFSIASNDCSTVLPGGSCSIDLTFTPASVGTETGSFSVAYCFLDTSGACISAPQPLGISLTGQGFVPSVSITSDDPDAAEAGLDPGSFVLVLDQPTAIPLNINYTVTGSATPADDYQTLSSPASIGAGQQQITIAVNPLDDSLIEADETVQVNLQSGAFYAIATPAAATVRIVSDDVETDAPTVRITTIQDAEEEGPVSGRFRVSLSEASSQPLQISYAVGGTATASADYSALPGLITVPAAQLSADIIVDPVDDDEIESDETVIVTLISISPGSANYVFDTSTRAQLRILDNDSDSPLPQVSINAAANAAEEGLVDGAFSVTLDAPAPASGLTISYSIAGSATAGLDYQALSGTLTLSGGQSSASITVTPLSDSEIEGDETVELTLLSDASYQINPSAAEANIIITDFVEALPQVSINAVSNASENDLVNGSFRVTLSTPAPGDLTVLYNVAGSASPDLDYQVLPGMVSFSAGQTTTTIPVVPLSDNEVEDDESVQLTLLIDSSYVINASASQAQILITDLIIPDTPLSDLPLSPPQKEVAMTIENLCRERLATNNFLRDCDSLVAAAVNGDPNTIDALAQITPDDVTTAVDIAETSVQAQLRNIRTRLFTLRRNRTGIDVDDLHLDFDAWVLSGKHLRMLAEQGGAAGDEDSSDARAQREPSRLGIFISGDIGLGDHDASENQDGFEFSTYGVTAGLDYRFTDQLVAGAALSYATNDTDINNRGGNLDSDGYALTLYGMYYLSDKVYIDGSLSYGRYNYDQERNLRYQLNGLEVDQTFDADYDGRQYSADIGGGYEFVHGQLLFGPTARLNYVESIIKGYSERARNDNPGSAWAVQIEEQKQRSLTVSVGAQATYVIPQSWGSLSPQLDVEWVHELLDDDLVVNGRFVEGDDTQENQFQLPTDEADSNYFSLGAGVSAQWDVGASAFIRYRTVLGYDRLNEHSINAGFRWEF